MDHEDAGHWARNVFLVVALLEIIALFAKKRSVQIARVALWGSAVVGIFGFAAILKAADKGGEDQEMLAHIRALGKGFAAIISLSRTSARNFR